jgi:DNA-binding CsgD family transcriptional regulator
MIARSPSTRPLSLRKLTVLLHLEDGKSYKQTAAVLGISESMVRLHVNEIAALLPASTLPPKDRVLLYCDRLLAAQPDVVSEIMVSLKRSA